MRLEPSTLFVQCSRLCLTVCVYLLLVFPGALFVCLTSHTSHRNQLQVTQAAAAMPLRVRRIDSVLEQLEAGDLKLRSVGDGVSDAYCRF